MSVKRGLPSFIQKLWTLLQTQSKLQHIICWARQGLSFTILNHKKFSQSILPRYFRHSNFTSFVRQLNMYNFHKVKNNGQYLFQFSHQLFRRDYKQLLIGIKRKPNQNDLVFEKQLLKKYNLKVNGDQIIQKIPPIKNPPSTVQEVKTQKDEIIFSQSQHQMHELFIENKELKKQIDTLIQQRDEIKAHTTNIINKVDLLFKGLQLFQTPLNLKNFKVTEFIEHLKSDEQPYSNSSNYLRFSQKPESASNIYLSIPMLITPPLFQSGMYFR